MNHLPIGLFDSGLGGLTVMKQIAQLLPHEHLIYLGDTAHLPYGDKSPEAIRKFSSDNASFLLSLNIKLLVIACHTACSYALESLQKSLSIPVIGVTSQAADLLNSAHRLAILATSSTIASNSLQTLLLNRYPNLKLFPVSCPLFVPLVEEGLQNHPASYLLAEHYLSPLRDQKIDTALLACTHYPLMRDPIQKALPNTQLIEPAGACSFQIKKTLQQLNLLNPGSLTPHYTFYASDNPEKFRRQAPLFLDLPIDKVHLRT